METVSQKMTPRSLRLILASGSPRRAGLLREAGYDITVTEPPMTDSNVPGHVAGGGLHELTGRRIYVSRGIGCERGQAPRIRFLCPPEITRILIPARSE